MNLRERFARWTARRDPRALVEVTTPVLWFPFELVGTAFFAIIAGVPLFAEFFQLPFSVGWLVFQVPIVAFLVAWYVVQHGPDRPAAWLAELAVVTSVKGVAAALTLAVAPVASPLFGALFVNLAGFYGFMQRASSGEPFPSLGTGVAAGVALLAFDAGPTQHAVIGVALLVALIVELTFGAVALRLDRAAAESGRLKAAIEAQIDVERRVELAALQDVVHSFLAARHDVNNALAAALLDGAMIREATLGQSEDVDEMTASLAASLDRARRIVANMHGEGRRVTHAAGAPARQVVSIEHVLDELLGAVRRRHPSVMIAVHARDLARVRVALVGGETSLRRILENLLVNACQGDGTRTATNVRVVVFRDASGARAHVEVADNGPGFRDDLLRAPIEGFVTTKADGSGLGLYTVERLVRMSGGHLQRSNLPEGGASVVALLPLEAS